MEKIQLVVHFGAWLGQPPMKAKKQRIPKEFAVHSKHCYSPAAAYTLSKPAFDRSAKRSGESVGASAVKISCATAPV
ncbi:hypothetical protein D3C85_1830960 [compost metagenome]